MQVKGGGAAAKDICDLIGTVGNQKAIGGILIMLDEPTKPMRNKAASAGRYELRLWQQDYSKIQIVTIAGLLDGAETINARRRSTPSPWPPAKRPSTSRRRCLSYTAIPDLE